MTMHGLFNQQQTRGLHTMTEYFFHVVTTSYTGEDCVTISSFGIYKFCCNTWWPLPASVQPTNLLGSVKSVQVRHVNMTTISEVGLGGSKRTDTGKIRSWGGWQKHRGDLDQRKSRENSRRAKFPPDFLQKHQLCQRIPIWWNRHRGPWSLCWLKEQSGVL